MPLFLLGAAMGAFAVFKFTDEVNVVVRYAALGGGVYLAGKAMKVW